MKSRNEYGILAIKAYSGFRLSHTVKLNILVYLKAYYLERKYCHSDTADNLQQNKYNFTFVLMKCSLEFVLIVPTVYLLSILSKGTLFTKPTVPGYGMVN